MKQRFYRAVSHPARFGKPGEVGKQFYMSFRADDMREARDHANHCFALMHRAKALGLKVAYVNFLGTIEPPLMGELREWGN